MSPSRAVKEISRTAGRPGSYAQEIPRNSNTDEVDVNRSGCGDDAIAVVSSVGGVFIAQARSAVPRQSFVTKSTNVGRLSSTINRADGAAS